MQNNIRPYALVRLCLLPMTMFASAPEHLRCEFLSEPLGLDCPAPHCSGQVADTRTSARQITYQVPLAAWAKQGAVPGLPDTTAWKHSVWITSDVQVPMDDFTRSWQEAALLDFASQKKAEPQELDAWYRHAHEDLATARSPVVFGKTFALDKPVTAATLRISGLGYFHARINGVEAGDFALAPNFTHYDAEARFLTLDVSKLLRAGENRIEVTVAHGRLRELPGRMAKYIYRETPVLRAELSITHPKGGVTKIGTDPSWQAGFGPVRQAGFWVGEAYDATAKPGGWQPAEVAKNFAPAMHADDLPPQRIVRELDPVAVTQPQPGVWVYDFGRMTAGKARVQVPPNASVTIRYANLLHGDIDKQKVRQISHSPFIVYPSGTDRENPGMIRPMYRCTCPVVIMRKGKPSLMEWGYADCVRSVAAPLDYHATFDYTGYRYVEITGLDKQLPVGAVKALEICNDLPRTAG